MPVRADSDDFEQYFAKKKEQRKLAGDAAKQRAKNVEPLKYWGDIYQPIVFSNPLPKNIPTELRKELQVLRAEQRKRPKQLREEIQLSEKELHERFWEHWAHKPFDLKGIPTDSFWQEWAARIIKFTGSIDTVSVDRLRKLNADQELSNKDGGRMIAIRLLNIAASRDNKTLTELLSKPDCQCALAWFRGGVRRYPGIADDETMFLAKGLLAEILESQKVCDFTVAPPLPQTIDELRAKVVEVVDRYKSMSDDEVRRSLAAVGDHYLALWNSALRLSGLGDRPPSAPAWARRNESSDFADAIRGKVPDGITTTTEDLIRDLDTLLCWVDEHVKLREADVETPEPPARVDLRDYATATEIRTKHTPAGIVLDHRKLVKFLSFHLTIRTANPPGRDGKPRTNRLIVHLADWVKHEDALKEWDAADRESIDAVPESEIAKRKAAVDRKKQRRK
jgi:hypothetical protein